MAGLMASIRIGVVTLLALVVLNVIGVFSLGDVSAAGEAGISKVPGLFNDKDKDKGGGGNGNGNGNGNQDVASDDSSDDEGDEDNGKKDKKDKKDKGEKNKSEKSADESDDADDESDDDSDKNPQSGNVDCDDVDGMIEYLKNRNMNGAIHANENGADNAALGALNKCRDKGADEDEQDSEDGTPVSDEATPVSDDATPVGEDDEDDSDGNVSVIVDIDEDGNGTIEYDLDGDGEVDLIAIVEDGEVVEYVEVGADDGTPEATPEAA